MARSDKKMPSGPSTPKRNQAGGFGVFSYISKPQACCRDFTMLEYSAGDRDQETSSALDILLNENRQDDEYHSGPKAGVAKKGVESIVGLSTQKYAWMRPMEVFKLVAP